ncbi:hypothetical protein EON63_02320 [archaeon]|nr:MAG: hypothetical protein EON63_02320 [archaeon]
MGSDRLLATCLRMDLVYGKVGMSCNKRLAILHTPYTLHPTSYTLYRIPYTIYHISHAINPTYLCHVSQLHSSGPLHAIQPLKRS